MHKFATTVLALALATTHGLLDEGGPIVQDAPRGLRGDAQADSSLDRATVGRKLEFGYTDDTPTVAPTSSEPTPTPLNGCGEPCADVITLSSSFPTIESGTCYVVDGTFPSSTLTVPDGVDCANITVPSDSSLSGINAHFPRPS